MTIPLECMPGRGCGGRPNLSTIPWQKCLAYIATRQKEDKRAGGAVLVRTRNKTTRATRADEDLSKLQPEIYDCVGHEKVTPSPLTKNSKGPEDVIKMFRPTPAEMDAVKYLNPHVHWLDNFFSVDLCRKRVSFSSELFSTKKYVIFQMIFSAFLGLNKSILIFKESIFINTTLFSCNNTIPTGRLGRFCSFVSLPNSIKIIASSLTI